MFLLNFIIYFCELLIRCVNNMNKKMILRVMIFILNSSCLMKKFIVFLLQVKKIKSLIYKKVLLKAVKL